MQKLGSSAQKRKARFFSAPGKIARAFLFSLPYIFRIAFCKGCLCQVWQIYICHVINNLRSFRSKSPLDKIFVIAKTPSSRAARPAILL